MNFCVKTMNFNRILCVEFENLRQILRAKCANFCKCLNLKRIFANLRRILRGCLNFKQIFVNFKQIFKGSTMLFAPIFTAFVLNACSLAPSPQANPTTYILKANDKIVLQRQEAHKKSIQIATTQSVLYLKTNEIAYIKDNELNSYSKHSWKSSPTSSLATLLAAKFEKNRLFEVVLNANSQLRADLVLESRFDSFEQVFESEKDSSNDEEKSFIHLELSANLVENETKKLLGFKHFSYKIPVQKIAPSSAVASFDEALNQLGDDIVLWLDGLLK